MTTDREIVYIFYASETGTAAAVADEIRALLSTHLKCHLSCISFMSLDALCTLARENANVLFVVATAGDGDPPRSLKPLWQQLLRANLSRGTLAGLRVGVLGLGDSSYTLFNAAARRLRARIQDLGAICLCETVLADDTSVLGPDAAIDEFIDSAAIALGMTENEICVARSTKLLPRVELILADELERDGDVDKWISGETTSAWIDATVLCNDALTNSEHLEDDREVRKVAFNIVTAPEGDLLHRPHPGDIIELRPRNRASAVEAFFLLTGIHPNAKVSLVHQDLKHDFDIQFPCRADALIASIPDLGGRVRRRFLARLAHYVTDPRERERLTELSSAEAADEFAAYAVADMRTPLMVLRDFPSARPPLDALIDMLPRLRPRAFSISASNQIEICAAIDRFVTPLRFARVGAASGTLLRTNVGDVIPIRAHPGPRPNVRRAMILIAAGAGAAFIRPVIQASMEFERLVFYGCRNEKGDFLYADEWRQLETSSKFTLFTAFSREGPEKIYVQDRIRENSQLVWNWIHEKNAAIYVSGRAGAFAREVRIALVDVVEEHGKMHGKMAEKFVRSMQKRKDIIFECW